MSRKLSYVKARNWIGDIIYIIKCAGQNMDTLHFNIILYVLNPKEYLDLASPPFYSSRYPGIGINT